MLPLTYLKKQLYIQKLLSGCLLVIFAISTVPKALFHSVFADHKDTYVFCGHDTHKTACVKAADTHCHLPELVVNVPYVYASAEECIGLPGNCAPALSFVLPKPIKGIILSKDSRGPPILV